VPRRHTAFWALLFILFLWGHNPWFFSGFLHWNVLGLVMTYPSTFSKGVVFLALAAHLQFLRSRDSRWLLAMVGASFVIVLAHPIDAVFLWITAGAVCIGIPELGSWR